MPDLSIANLPAIPTLDAADVFPITDATDLTTKKGSVSQLDGRYVGDADINAKGDLFVGTAADTVGILTVGANDTMLMADSATGTGQKWAAPSVVRTALGLGNAALLTVDPDLATLALPASTTISAFGASLVDDIDAATAQATLGLAAAFQALDADLTALAAAGNSGVLAATTASFLIADETKLDGIEALADVTDTLNVTAAGALMDSEVASLAAIKNLVVPDLTTITAFGASLVDDADAATARATLGIAALFQPLDADLTAIAASPSTEIEAYYNAAVSVVSQAEAEAGTATTVRRWTAQRVAQAIAALAPGGGGGGAAITEVLTASVSTNAVARATVVVTAVGVTPASQIMVTWGNVLDTDTNSPEMDNVCFFATPGTGEFTLKVVSAINNFISGPFRINYLVG